MAPQAVQNQPGCFITLEGGEGAGKSSHVRTIADYLEQQGIDVITSREPGGTVVSEAIRETLLNPQLPAMHFDTELLLMFAARSEHLQQLVIPALSKGTWVVCDRFTDASYAYQGYGRGVPLQRIAALENWVQGALRPDHTLLFDIDVATGQQRVAKRSADNLKQPDRIDQEEVDFHEKIRVGYLQRAEQFPEQFIKIQAAQSFEQVGADILKHLDEIVQSRAVA